MTPIAIPALLALMETSSEPMARAHTAMAQLEWRLLMAYVAHLEHVLDHINPATVEEAQNAALACEQQERTSFH